MKRAIQYAAWLRSPTCAGILNGVTETGASLESGNGVNLRVWMKGALVWILEPCTMTVCTIANVLNSGGSIACCRHPMFDSEQTPNLLMSLHKPLADTFVRCPEGS